MSNVIDKPKSVSVASFADLRAAGLKPVAAKKVERSKDKAPKAETQGRDRSRRHHRAESGDPRPELVLDVRMDETFGKLAAVIEAVFSARGFDNVMAFTENAITCLAADEARKGDLPMDKALLRVMEYLLNQCGAGPAQRLNALRCKRLLTILDTVPAMDGGNMVRLKGETLIPVERAKDATSALAVYTAFAGLDVAFLEKLDLVKTTPKDSLRDKKLRRMRDTVPDLGAALIVAAINAGGFARTSGMPLVNMVRTNFPTMVWLENLLKDLRKVIGEDDEILRGEILVEFVDGENSMSSDEFAELTSGLKEIMVADDATAFERARADTVYKADKQKFDVLKAEWTAIQNELDAVQQDAVGIVDAALALIRHKKSEKDWVRAQDKESTTPRARSGSSEDRGNKTIAPAAKRVRPPKVTSANTPDQGAFEAQLGGVEVEVSVPRFNAESFGISRAIRQDIVKGASLDGVWECAAYAGVVWEVVMIADHAMDLDRVMSDCTMVVIAPRRVGGMGVDIAESRALLKDEFEQFFTAVQE